VKPNRTQILGALLLALAVLIYLVLRYRVFRG
jgi:hypothetical protein